MKNVYFTKNNLCLLLILLLSIICIPSFSQVPCPDNLAVSFDGKNDRIVIPHSPKYQIDVDQDFTFEAWINASPSQIPIPIIFSHRSVVSTSPLVIDGFLVGLWVDGSLFIQMHGSNKPRANSGDLRDGKCHHVVVRRKNNEVHYFVDGSFAGGFQSGAKILTSSPYNAYIGHDHWTQGGSGFHGEIDEVRFWNIARTNDQITGSMLTPLIPATTNGLIGYWNFNNDQGGQIAFDESTVMNHGMYGSSTNVDINDPRQIVPNCISSNSTNARFNYSRTCNTYHFSPQNLISNAKYSWDFDGDGTIDSYSQQPTHSYNKIGTYLVRLYVDDGSCTSFYSILIQIGFGADAGPDDKVCKGASYTVGNPNWPSYYNYQWYWLHQAGNMTIGQILNGETNRTLTRVANGQWGSEYTYMIVVTDPLTGCVARDTVTVAIYPSLNGSPCGIVSKPGSIGNGPVKLIPNPASDYVTIEFPEGHGDATIYIIDSQGNIRRELATSETSVQVEISELPLGIYQVLVVRDQVRFSAQLEIIH